MNKISLNAAVKRFTPLIEGKKEDEIREMILSDDKKFTQLETDEIYAAICTQFNKPKEAAKEVVKISPNDELDLSFLSDYSQLNAIPYVDEDGEGNIKASDDYKKYIELVDKLPLQKMFDFHQFNGRNQLRTTKSGKLLPVGVVIFKDKPINTTRIPVWMAKEYNAQIDPTNPDTNTRYFLLKK